MKKLLCLFLPIFLLCGCSQKEPTAETVAVSPTIAAVPDMFTDRDQRTEAKNCYTIVLSDSGSTSDCSSVEIAGSTITITQEADYKISGALANGMIIVDTEKDAKVHLILDSVSVSNTSGAALYIKQSDKVVVTLNGSSSLTSGEVFTPIDDNNIDSTVFSKDDLTFNGAGSLTVTAPTGHGIVSKDDLVFTGGSYTVTSANHGLDANDSIRAKDSDFQITAGKDGLHAENNDDASLGFIYLENGKFNIRAEGDGISAGSYVQIIDGTYELLTGGGYINGQKQTSDHFGGFGGRPGGGKPGGPGGRPGGYYTPTAATTTDTTDSDSIKGIKAGAGLSIASGSFSIDSADDALHSNTNVTVCGGEFQLSTGDDGIHADETLSLSGGTVVVTASYEGLEGLNVQISGGNITLTAKDDGINAAGGQDQSGYGGIRGDRFGGHGGASNGSIAISGGTIYMNASGDGIDANGTLTITGGHITVCGPTSGDTAVLDYDKTASIIGGTFIGTGSAMMAQSFSESSQGVIAISVGNQSAGTPITIKDAKGTVILEETPILNYQILIFSSPELKSGENYTVTIGSMTESITAN